jgi:S1-C subfamily serine protease
MAVTLWMIAAEANAPRLGVRPEPHEKGCLITEVASDSAAAVAGLRVGDVLTAVDDEPVTQPATLIRLIRGKQVGQKVVVQFLRDGKSLEVDAVLTRPPE